MARTAFQFTTRIVYGGGAVPTTPLTGTIGDDFKRGAILSLTLGGKLATLGDPIDDDIGSPVKYVALSDYDGVAATVVAVQEITADTVLEGQFYSGTAADADIGKQGVLQQDATTGNYAVDVSSATNASIEVLDVEPNFHGVAPNTGDAYNLVRFKFLPAVLDIAPAVS